MFKPATMMRLSAVVLERDERVVLRGLGESGVVQLTRTQPGPEMMPQPPGKCADELARCDRFLTRVENLRRSLEITALTKEQPPIEMTLDQADQALRSVEAEVAVLLKRRQHLMQRWNELTAVGEKVSGYQAWDVPLDRFDEYSFLHFVTGSLPAENLESLQNQVSENVALLPLPEQKGWQPLIAMTTRQGRAVLENALQQAGFQRESLPAVEGATTASLFKQNQREQEQVSAELASVNADVQALAAKVAPTLTAIERLASVEHSLLEAGQNFAHTASATLLTGWVPADEAPTLEQRVKENTYGVCAIEMTSAGNLAGEQIPVLLRHPRWLRPFQMLVSGYGLPNYHELEPTLFVAISYVLMFGMMFGDAGHGAVLAMVGLAGMLAGRNAKMRDLGLLLLFGGLSSMAFGIIYGSCFGLEQFKKYALWHDPLEGDPMDLMYGAIGIGIVIISLGLILNVINRFRRGDWVGGFLDKFGVIGALFYWGMLALVVNYAGIESRGLVKLALILFLAVPIAGWVLKEPIEYFLRRRADHPIEPDAGFFAVITESLVGAFEAMLSYLANTISFVRLAAYAMSHAALLMAAFMMAGEVKHVSVGGGVLSVLVIILGNLVAIVLEGIIASVQALRLEYYEFFGKFFSGNGRPFEPFRLTTVQTSRV